MIRFASITMHTLPDSTGNYERALELARSGYLPVAILPGTKIPAEKGWQQWEEPVSEESIARRWKGTRNGIALLCKDILVIDVDDASLLDEVLAKCGLKDAPICRTPRGGYHVHARVRRGVKLQRTIKVRGQELDLLTGPSLSILPPHTNEAGIPYEWLTNGLPVKSELPVAKIGWTRERTRKRTVQLILPVDNAAEAVRRARAYVARIEPAISGQNGHSQTFRVAVVLILKFSLSFEQAWSLLLEYSERCLPPWSEKELRHKLEDALKLRR